MKKHIALFLAFLMAISLAACGNETAGEPTDPGTDIFTPEIQTSSGAPVMIDPPVEMPEPEPEEISLTFTEDEWPIVDGATAFLPYYQEMAARMLGITNDEAGQHIMCSTTDYAYPYLWQGKTDMVFCLRPSQEQTKTALDEYGVVFEEVPFAREGFVFFVNKNNPVDSITVEQLHDIYAGKITNWKELGGNDEEIIAYQRTEGSGSQTGLYLHVISPDEIQEPPIEKRISTMGEIIDAVAGYSNAEGALGYSYRYFVTNMHYDEQIKMLKVDGVYPDYENIADGSYPLISDVCAVYREDEATDSAVRKIANWCASSQGAMLAKELGYVPTSEAEGTLFKAEISDPDDVTVDYAVGNPCPECTVQYTYIENNLTTQQIIVDDSTNSSFYADYVHISGLKDKNVERVINQKIEDAFYDVYNTDYPPYPGVRTRLAMFDKYKDSNDYYGFCSAYIQSNFNNILSISISKEFSKYAYTDEYSDELTVSDCRTLNLDLNTGKEIFIGDLFADNVDGIAYINDMIAAESDKPEAFDEPPLYRWGDEADIHFRRAFEGINKNQKYYINSWDGSLCIVLDYENPEIANFYTPTIYKISMLGINSYESRFMGEDSLFVDETVSPRLFEVPFDEKNAINYNDYVNGWIPEYNIDLSLSATIYEGMTQGVIAQLDPEFGWLDALEARARERYENLNKTAYSASASFYSSASRFGEYTNTYTNMDFYAWNSSWYYLDEFTERYSLCFAQGAENPLGLNELFAPDCDMYQVMEDTVVSSITDFLGEYYGKDTYVAMFRETITSLRGFCVTSDSIVLDCYKINDIINTYLPAESDNWEVRECLTNLKYKDLGMENLTIFN